MQGAAFRHAKYRLHVLSSVSEAMGVKMCDSAKLSPAHSIEVTELSEQTVRVQEIASTRARSPPVDPNDIMLDDNDPRVLQEIAIGEQRDFEVQASAMFEIIQQ